MHDHGHHHHPHRHDHAHAHGAHGHDISEETDHAHPAEAGTSGRMHAALVLTTVVMLIEAIGGWWTHSLALLADAGHMLADAGSLLLAVLAIRAARRPADTLHSYGHGRFLVLAAFVNGLLLLAVSAWIAVEAVLRLITPQQVEGGVMAAIAMVGLVANLVAFAFLHGAHEHDLNRRSAAAHVLSDLLGSVAALAAGGIILLTGWMRADPLLSLFAASLIVRTGVKVTRESAHVLLEGAPPGMNLSKVANELPKAVAGVASVHHLHAWSLTPGDNLMTLHAVLTPAADVDDTLARIQAWLQATYRIGHITVQIEREVCAADPACAADARQ
ncbi:MAG TPA: cation diffusion facilitator family transporter [Nevskiaceae bacterium]|nr:cation diffusion facilitator family transporter [Nevskiaceae bacterium]